MPLLFHTGEAYGCRSIYLIKLLSVLFLLNIMFAEAAKLPPPVSATQSASGASASTTLPAATEKVRCNFTSSPPGAEITLDGKYVGNTPSEIAVSAGDACCCFLHARICPVEAGPYSRGGLDRGERDG